MKAIIEGVGEFGKVFLIPETDQEIASLDQMARGQFLVYREYRVKEKLTVFFVKPPSP